MCLTRIIQIDPVVLAKNTTYVIVALAVVFFLSMFLFGKLSRIEKKRTAVIVILFFASAVFWSGFEQAGSSLTLFADRHTDQRHVRRASAR